MGHIAKSVVLALVLFGLISTAHAQPGPAQPPWMGRKSAALGLDGAPNQQRANKFAPWRRLWLEREDTTTAGLGMRAALREELHRVPTLEKYFKEFFAIQRERIELERQRHALAARTDLPGQQQLVQFHHLLSREDQLASRSADLLKQLRCDRDKIEREIKARLEELDLAADTPASPTNRKTGENKETASRKRWRRFYTAVMANLTSLDSTPSAPEWFGTLARSLWQFEHADYATLDSAMRQLERLQREQEDLGRRIREIQEQLDDIAEILAALRSDQSPQVLPRTMPDEPLPPRPPAATRPGRAPPHHPPGR